MNTRGLSKRHNITLLLNRSEGAVSVVIQMKKAYRLPFKILDFIASCQTYELLCKCNVTSVNEQ